MTNADDLRKEIMEQRQLLFTVLRSMNIMFQDLAFFTAELPPGVDASKVEEFKQEQAQARQRFLAAADNINQFFASKE